MKFILQRPLKDNVYNLMRKIGYSFWGKDENGSELIFSRPPRGYPRFHLFLTVKEENLIFNLHLDQKRPSYKGSPAHAGEHQGKSVAEEIERIKKILK